MTELPIGLAASCAIVVSFTAMFWYNALVTPLAFTLPGVRAALARLDRARPNRE